MARSACVFQGWARWLAAGTEATGGGGRLVFADFTNRSVLHVRLRGS